MSNPIPCPGCGQILRAPDGVTDPTLTCPCCLADVANPGGVTAAGGPPAANAEVRWDTKATAAGVLIMGVLVALGLFFSFAVAPERPGESRALPVVIVIAVVFVAAVAAGVMELLKPTTQGGLHIEWPPGAVHGREEKL